MKKKSNSSQRRLKVYSRYRAKRWGGNFIPEIRLAGEWLRRLGFTQGKEIIIEQAENKLTITMIEPNRIGANFNYKLF